MRDSLIEHGGAGTEKRRYGFLLLSLCVFVMVLIMTEMTPLVADDYDMAYPFRELGWDIGEEISPHIYTKKQWSEWTFLPYHKNVERDKIVLA